VLRLAAERSGGNPQFLRDLLRAAHAPGADGELPESIEAAANARIDRLQARDRALVRRAAVLGRSFHPRYLSDVTEDGSSPDEATWERLDNYFERDGDGHVRFRRALVRDVAYAGLSFRLRRELHAAAGARLEDELGEEAAGATPMLSLHFLLAGDHGRAWRHARVAADRARQQFAQADAAQLYERALQAARGLDVVPTELAAVWRALGDARAATGELQAAAHAYTAARSLLRDDPVELGVLLARHAELEMRAGRAGRAVRWVRRGLRLVEGAEHGPAAALRARLISTLAVARQRQGRMTQAIEVCREAIAAAEAAGEDTALAHACYVLDWALVESGRAEEAVYSERALEIYHRLGDLDRESAVLNNLGGFAYRDGRWEEAIRLYLRGAEASERAGDAANAAFGDCNVGEVLADQGRYAEAEPRLRRAIRVWRATDYEWGVAYATSRLGRLAVRTGRIDEGSALLEEARGRFDALSLQGDVDFADALLAEAAVFGGRPERALEIADRLLERAGETVWSAPLLHRLRGRALMAAGDARGAEDALRASLAEARKDADVYETALTIDAIDELLGADEALRRERDELLSTLGIVSVPRPESLARHRASSAR
jgi:tetratricopeptide (TPR) repeat protein